MKNLILLALPLIAVACSKGGSSNSGEKTGVYKMTSMEADASEHPLLAVALKLDLQDPVDNYIIDRGNNTYTHVSIDHTEGYEGYELEGTTFFGDKVADAYYSCQSKKVKTVVSPKTEDDAVITKSGNQIILSGKDGRMVYTEIGSAEVAKMQAEIKSLKRSCVNDSDRK